MSDFIAAVLTFLIVSPAIVVLAVLIGRGVRARWQSLSPFYRLTRLACPGSRS